MSKYTDLSDIELFEKIVKYDSRALEELYERYSPILFSLIKKITPDIKTAEMILSDVFVIVWRKIDMFDFKSGNVYTWLITLARNRAVDRVRRDRSAKITLTNYNDEYEDFFIMPDLEEGIDAIDLKTALKIKPKIEEALENLTDAQKYVIHLSYYEGYTLNEIAERLNIPIETVRMKINAALHNLKDNLIS